MAPSAEVRPVVTLMKLSEDLRTAHTELEPVLALAALSSALVQPPRLSRSCLSGSSINASHLPTLTSREHSSVVDLLRWRAVRLLALTFPKQDPRRSPTFPKQDPRVNPSSGPHE